MLEDRAYMRQSPGHYRSAAMTLMWVIFGCYLLQQADYFYNGGGLNRLLALSADGMRHAYLWQLLTFQFLHAGFLHIAFNLFGLYTFGRGLEEVIGTRRFLQVYFASGVIGGLFQVALGFAGPRLWGGTTVGASAGICGMIAVYATLEPHGTVSIWGFPMRAKPFALAIGLLSLFFIAVPIDTTANGAHLGGLLAGYAFVRWFFHNDWSLPKFRFRSAPRPRELVNAPSGSAFWKKSKPLPADEPLPSGDFISKEVDPILDKISAHGIQSLTDQERRILEAARAKMSKR